MPSRKGAPYATQQSIDVLMEVLHKEMEARFERLESMINHYDD
jgi:hypothetical protein